MDFCATPPPPPPPPPPSARSEKLQEEDDRGWKVDHIFMLTKEMLGWCTNKYKTGRDHMGVPPSIMVGGVLVVGFAALGIVLALPTKSKAVLVNFWGFVLPALATIDEMDTTGDRRSKPPSSPFTGYWVSSLIAVHYRIETRGGSLNFLFSSSIEHLPSSSSLDRKFLCSYSNSPSCRLSTPNSRVIQHGFRERAPRHDSPFRCMQHARLNNNPAIRTCA